MSFAALCQANSVEQGDPSNAVQLDQAKYTIGGSPVEGWPRQNDGPALQTLALIAAFAQLSVAAQDTARSLITANASFVLQHYQEPNHNLWEEVSGQSFFTRSVQLQCLSAITDNALSLFVPDGIEDAKTWLRAALDSHWKDGLYVSVLEPQNPRADYDPNSDIVAACIYGAIPCTDPKLLSTAAQLRRRCADSPSGYPINITDAAQGLGPLIGRYPGDVYDGDVVSADDPRATRNHPWAVCTANYAELYYQIAAAITAAGQLPADPLTQDFLSQAGVAQHMTPSAAASALTDAGDRMLRTIIYHSDHLELSEQFDADTGYEKSVRNLSWSYAAALSALRARNNQPRRCRAITPTTAALSRRVPIKERLTGHRTCRRPLSPLSPRHP